jgi:hypothetical protein
MSGDPSSSPATTAAAPVGGSSDARVSEPDRRLDRLFDYTKFHMSLCLSASGALATLIASADKSDVIKNLVGQPKALAAALASMLIAAMTGGVIASSIASCVRFEDFWNVAHGPFALRCFKGRTWAAIEHTAFWLSVVLIVVAVLSKPSVLHWLSL